MGLRSFHLFFIVISVILTAFFAAWAAGQYQTAHQVSYAVTAGVSLASGVGLVIYAAAFIRKTKQL